MTLTVRQQSKFTKTISKIIKIFILNIFRCFDDEIGKIKVILSLQFLQ
jgi:hypothetical protein